LNPLHGLVLGVVQGLGEFLPISSSAHLLLVPWLFGWPEHSLTFDVALHMGTLAALLAYFWRDWWQLVTAWLPQQRERRRIGATRGVSGVSGVSGDKPNDAAHSVTRAVTEGPPLGAGRSDATPDDAEDLVPDEVTASGDGLRSDRRRLGISLAISTVPAAIVGALFAERIEASLRAPVLVAALLLVAAALLASADRAGIQDRELGAVGVWQALVIGVAQALALAPGVSRSGASIAAALFLGLTRQAAARYAFLMAAPITAGAGIFQLRHLVSDGIPADERMAFLVGITSSFVVGLLAIGGLLRYLRTRSLDVFVGYRVILGLVILIVAALRLR
jgi:undecaprenyl-diphosphatase